MSSEKLLTSLSLMPIAARNVDFMDPDGWMECSENGDTATVSDAPRRFPRGVGLKEKLGHGVPQKGWFVFGKLPI